MDWIICPYYYNVLYEVLTIHYLNTTTVNHANDFLWSCLEQLWKDSIHLFYMHLFHLRTVFTEYQNPSPKKLKLKNTPYFNKESFSTGYIDN